MTAFSPFIENVWLAPIPLAEKCAGSDQCEGGGRLRQCRELLSEQFGFNPKHTELTKQASAKFLEVDSGAPSGFFHCFS
jgi:hypothetical protein